MRMKVISGCIVMVLLLSTLAGPMYADEENKINLNTATVEQLVKIPGLNQDLAKKIIELREENGEFIDLEELLDVDGITNQLLRQLKKHLFIEEVDDCNC